MKKVKIFPYIIGAIAALLFIGLSLYIFCPALNVHNLWLWLIIDITLLIFVVVERFAKGCKDFGWVTIKKKTGSKEPVFFVYRLEAQACEDFLHGGGIVHFGGGAQ